jgi:outer membrane protein OmpA-like peptidoglycan-associated protein/tetratricopeptide (TPR) repeat protein
MKRSPLDMITSSGFFNPKLFSLMRLIAIVIFMALSFSVQAQRKKNVVVGDQAAIQYEQGKILYDKDKYTEAIPYFQAAIKADATNQDSFYYLGLCYRYTDQSAKAILEFNNLKGLNQNYWPWFYYEAGVAYSELKKFDEAIEMYTEFLKRYPADASKIASRHKAQYRLHYAKEQKALQNAVQIIKPPVKLSASINSNFDDYMPTLDPTGTKLYFTSQRLGGIGEELPTAKEGDEDIYFIEKSNGVWSNPKLLPEPINSASNDGASCFSADGQLMVYAACGKEGGIGSCDIYIATLEGNQWTKPVNIGNVVNSDDWDSQPTISNDGNRIIFSSSRSGGYGGEDLYMIERNLFGEWGPAMNLGGIVNTPFTDFSPFLSQDGKTLYFASSGHPGYGGTDIFKTTLENGKWTMPVNLGRPLNTEGDDRYFTIGGSGEIGYFATNAGGGSLDLYEVEIPEEMRPQPTVIVEGVVTNSKTKALVGAYVMVEDVNSGELIAINKSNSATGKYLVVLPAGKTYSVSANKEGFFFHSELVDVPVTAKFQTIKKDIELKPIEKGAKIVINNIFFETGKATLSPQSNVELEKAVDLLKTNPTMTIEEGGHTDNVGDDAYNMKLSHDRAKSVREYLVKAGIQSERVQAKGYGESNPIATNDTEDGRKANRRTEFVILEF